MKIVSGLVFGVVLCSGCQSVPDKQVAGRQPGIQLALDEYNDGIIKLQAAPPTVAPLLDETRNYGRVESEGVILEYMNRPTTITQAYRLMLTIKSTGEQIEIVLPYDE